ARHPYRMTAAAILGEGGLKSLDFGAENVAPAVKHAINRTLDWRLVRTILRQRRRPRNRRTHRTVTRRLRPWERRRSTDRRPQRTRFLSRGSRPRDSKRTTGSILDSDWRIPHKA